MSASVYLVASENRAHGERCFYFSGDLDSERPAVFLKSLEDAIGEEEGEVCLHCEISKETATPVWRKDGSVLTADDKHEFLQFGKARALIIRTLSKDDAGLYTCDFGTSQTKAKVTVHGECLENSSFACRGSGTKRGQFLESNDN